MRKLTALFLALTMVLSFAVVAYAANDTVLTTSVPAAVYTLVIPKDQTVEFGTQSKNLGTVTVEEASGFAIGKNLEVTVTYTPFTNSSNASTIPYTLYSYGENAGGRNSFTSGKALTFNGRTDGAVSAGFEHGDNENQTGVGILIQNSDWGKALAGEYTTTIHFSAEVVNS